MFACSTVFLNAKKRKKIDEVLELPEAVKKTFSMPSRTLVESRVACILPGRCPRGHPALCLQLVHLYARTDTHAHIFKHK